MALRKIRDERDARHCLARVERSDESLRDWAYRHGIDARSLNAWKLNLDHRKEKGRPRRPETQPVEVRLVELVDVIAPEPATPRAVTVSCGPLVVEVPLDLDDLELSRLLRAMVAAC